MRIQIHGIALVMLALAVAPPSGAATDPVIDADARAIFEDTMSPYCPGFLLADCGSAPAARLRDEIRAALARGVPAAEVRAGLEGRFGERILAAPRARGFGLVAWLVPPVALAAAVLLVARWIATRRRAASLPAPLLPDVDDARRMRLAEELARF